MVSKEDIKSYPTASGVYIMKDLNGTILYIGKAVNLKSRLRSYFSADYDGRYQIPFLMSKVDKIEWIITDNETEALILEANLVRTHKPPYNIDLKDDKHFPYIKVTLFEDYPRIKIVRKVLNDGAKYFGPYTDVSVMRKTVDLAKKLFGIRDCSISILKNGKKIHPCINYSMGICSAPCSAMITKEKYRKDIYLFIDFVNGKRDLLLKKFEANMEKASSELHFEKAAKFRDAIKMVKRFSSLQKVDLRSPAKSVDIFGFYDASKYVSFAIISFRNGYLLNKRNFVFKKNNWDFSIDDREHTIAEFYINSINEIPREIYCSTTLSINSELLGKWFETKMERKVNVVIPQRGNGVKLVKMAEENAKQYLAQEGIEVYGKLLEDTQNKLSLPAFPAVIEAFDISNLGEKFTVAAMVRFADGKPDSRGYRNFKIKNIEGQNDFAMMMEVVERRLSRLEKENKRFPDLLLIDGGKGQLSAAHKALAKFKSPPMLVSLAKKEELIFTIYSDEPVRLNDRDPVRKLFQRIRDEVHRRAITYHRKIRGKVYTSSKLESIKGIGKKKASELLRIFGSLTGVKKSSVEELCGVRGISKELAVKIKNGI